MLKPGMTISNRYEIIDKVGSGGMADVYKARDQRLNRFVAIKVLKPEFSNDRSFVNKFRGEAQSAAGLSHPNIVNVYDVGDDSGLHYIVMELVEGITLKRFIERKGKLDIKEAVGIGIQIAQGMDAAHENHIIHRDIKPQNIIISRDGKVKVTDFGIAKATNSNTITSNAMGSVHYLSPEQARGGYSDEKSDIYSLGVTLYEMLSGKVPFSGDNTVSVALLHIQAEAIPLRDMDPNIPFSIDKIVQKCMQKRPERRYHSASELIADLKKAITNPDGDFVQIPAFLATDSPTINISDDLSKIKNGAFLEEEPRNTKNFNTGSVIVDDEDDLDTVDAKVEKVFFIGTIVVAAIIVLAIVFAAVWFFNNGGKSPTKGGLTPTVSASPSPTVQATQPPESATFKMPNVLGKTKEDAIDTINSLDPTATVQYEDPSYSDEYDVDQVIKQYPKEDNDVKKGSTIILTLSLGKEEVVIPDVTKLSEANAQLKLTEKGLKVEHDFGFSDTIPKGSVISTNPVAGTKVKAGDKVTLIVSDGPENTQVSMPNLMDLSEAQAKQELIDAGLTLGKVTYEPTDESKVGKVTYQSESYKNMVTKGTAIDIKVGQLPTVYKGTLNITGNIFADNGLEAGTIHEFIFTMTQDGAEEVINDGNYNDTTIPKSIPIESKSKSTATVTLTIDGTPANKTWTVKFK